jgi:hypothetical protein
MYCIKEAINEKEYAASITIGFRIPKFIKGIMLIHYHNIRSIQIPDINITTRKPVHKKINVTSRN